MPFTAATAKCNASSQRFSWYCASFNQRLGERHGFLVKLQDLNIFKCPKSSRRR